MCACRCVAGWAVWCACGLWVCLWCACDHTLVTRSRAAPPVLCLRPLSSHLSWAPRRHRPRPCPALQPPLCSAVTLRAPGAHATASAQRRLLRRLQNGISSATTCKSQHPLCTCPECCHHPTKGGEPLQPPTPLRDTEERRVQGKPPQPHPPVLCTCPALADGGGSDLTCLASALGDPRRL